MHPLKDIVDSGCIINIHSVDDAMDNMLFERSRSHRVIVTHLTPRPGFDIGRPNHNSLTLDIKIPMLLPPSGHDTTIIASGRTLCGESVYKTFVWPYLLGSCSFKA